MTLLTEYRPRRATEILDASFQFYRAHAQTLLVIAAIVLVPPAVLAAIAPEGIKQIVEIAGNLLLPVAQGAIALVVAGALEGRTPRAEEAFGGLRGKIGALVATQIMAGIMIMFGLVLLIIPGLIAIVWTAVMQPAVAIEKISSGDALTRSRDLCRGHGGHVIGTLLLAGFLLIVMVIGGGVVVGIIGGMVGLPDRITELLGGLLIVPLYPIMAVATSLLYFDLRVRREGADIEAMAAALPGGQAARSA